MFLASRGIAPGKQTKAPLYCLNIRLSTPIFSLASCIIYMQTLNYTVCVDNRKLHTSLKNTNFMYWPTSALSNDRFVFNVADFLKVITLVRSRFLFQAIGLVVMEIEFSSRDARTRNDRFKFLCQQLSHMLLCVTHMFQSGRLAKMFRLSIEVLP